MALLDFLKSKKKTKKILTSEPSQAQTKRVKNIEHAYANTLILKRPLITERATALAQEGKYLFEVHIGANKNEIKKAIESIWPVEVVKVNIVNLPQKQIRFGRSIGVRGRRKKAIISLKEGYSIELLPK